MPRFSVLQTNFTAGEISPKLRGRVDIARYQNACETMRNAYPLIHGGAKRRPGTGIIASTKTHTKASRLIPYVFNADQSYMLEFGDLYMRVCKDGAQVESSPGVPYEISTPYLEAELFDLSYAQSADTMFIAHPDHQIYRLRRIDHADWSLAAAPFVTEPFDEVGTKPAATLTLSAATVGTGRTFTADASVFFDSDVGRYISYLGGLAKITGYTSGTVVTCEILSAFASTSIATGLWTLEGSPHVDIYPSAKDPVESQIELVTCEAPQGRGTFSANPTVGTTCNFTVTGATPFTAGDVGFEIISSDGVGKAEVTGYTSNTQVAVEVAEAFDGKKIAKGKWYITGRGKAWRSEDAGKFVKLNGGLVLIDSITSDQIALVTIKQAMSAAIPSPKTAWSLNADVWTAEYGYPSTVSFHEQRLIAAGSPSFPQTVWMSRTGESLNFELGTKDDDAISFTIASARVNQIKHVTQARALIALTSGSEVTMVGGVEKPITPTNVQVRTQSELGSSGAAPVKIGNEVLFAQRSGKKVRSMAYRFENDAYNAPDVSLLAEHILEAGVVEMAYQREPDPLLWCVMADGTLATLTLDREQDVIGWAPHDTDGLVESVATIPGTGGDEVWLIVNRTIGGVTKRYIERLSSTLNTDSAITGTSLPGATVWTGLSHLEGKTVDILADGSVMPQQVVASGEITLPRTAYEVEIGLHYETIIKLLPVEAPLNNTVQGKNVRTGTVTVRLLESQGCEIEGDTIPFRSFGSGVLDAQVESFTGDKEIDLLGWKKSGGDITIKQVQPLPLQVLAVIRKVSVNDQ